jgi:iron complex transport system ATP-binding protein
MKSNQQIEINDLKLGFDKTVILEDISMLIEQSQITTIAGPNGSGKTTFLKSLSRLASPISGSILLNNKELNSYRTSELAQIIGYIPQSIQTRPNLTVYEYIALGRSPHQSWWSWVQTDMDKDIVENTIKYLNLENLATKELATLSGGELQRTNIAMSLAQQPQFLLLDEPTNHLDFQHIKELKDILQDLKNQGIGIVLVLHDLNLAHELSDQICLLQKSFAAAKPAAIGKTRDVLTESILEKVFNTQIKAINDPQSEKVFFTY